MSVPTATSGIGLFIRVKDAPYVGQLMVDMIVVSQGRRRGDLAYPLSSRFRLSPPTS